ncbi:MAG TPA: cytochrome c [Paenalcaligenes sp.]|nr:cytochrome c [Paenalcaligenes sp.]
MNKNFLLTLSAALVTTVGLVTAPVALADNLEEGKQLFLSDAQPMACAICHTLQDAGSTGNIGPDLDDLRPEADRIHKVLIEGMGAMPAFGDSLSQEQRDAIVDYVVSATN